MKKPVEKKRRIKRVPVFLTMEEVQSLLSKPNKKSRVGMRDFILMKVLVETGARIFEVIGMRPKDIDWQTGRVTIVGKGSKERIIWLPPATMNLILTYGGKYQIKEDAPLWMNKLGDQVSERQIRVNLKNYAKRAGITKDVHLHTLRHTFATNYLQDTKDLRGLQKLLGHSSLDSTEVYTHVIDPELEKSVKDWQASIGALHGRGKPRQKKPPAWVKRQQPKVKVPEWGK